MIYTTRKVKIDPGVRGFINIDIQRELIAKLVLYLLARYSVLSSRRLKITQRSERLTMILGLLI